MLKIYLSLSLVLMNAYSITDVFLHIYKQNKLLFLK